MIILLYKGWRFILLLFNFCPHTKKLICAQNTHTNNEFQYIRRINNIVFFLGIFLSFFFWFEKKSKIHSKKKIVGRIGGKIYISCEKNNIKRVAENIFILHSLVCLAPLPTKRLTPAHITTLNELLQKKNCILF